MMKEEEAEFCFTQRKHLGSQVFTQDLICNHSQPDFLMNSTGCCPKGVYVPALHMAII